MNHVVAGAFMPHPPIMIPEIGKNEIEKIQITVAAAEEAARRIKEENPQTIVIITPHGAGFRDAASISIHPRLRGNLAEFGVPEVSLGFELDGLLARRIMKQTDRLGVHLVEFTDDIAKQNRLRLELDHGAMVPLYYMHKAGFKGQLVHLSIGMLPYEEMYTFGKAVQAAINLSGKRVAVIASGDLSHRLTLEAPAGYCARGAEFDHQVVAALEKLNVKELLSIDHDLIEEAGECGLRSAFFLTGVFGGMDAVGQVLSYEGPFGVGYAVIAFQKGSQKDGD